MMQKNIKNPLCYTLGCKKCMRQCSEWFNLVLSLSKNIGRIVCKQKESEVEDKESNRFESFKTEI